MTKRDIGFIIDSSGSVGSRNWKTIQTFIKKVTDHFLLDPRYALFGVETYSDQASVEIEFGAFDKKTSFDSAVSGLTWLQGKTRTDLALEKASNALFDSSHGSRMGVDKVALIITDGQTNGL